MNLNTQTYESLSSIFSRDFSSLLLLPKIEKLINKQEPTLEDVLGLCSHNESLLLKLTRRAGFGSNEDEFAKEILFKKRVELFKKSCHSNDESRDFLIASKTRGHDRIQNKKKSCNISSFY